MKRYLRIVLSMSLLAAMLSLAYCRGNGPAGQEESVSSDVQETTGGQSAWITPQP